MLLALIIFSLQFKSVQTYLAQKTAAYLSKELKTTVSIKSLYIKPFKSIVLEDLLVLDMQKDTLLRTPQFMVDINRLSIDKRIIDINTVQINNGQFFLKDFKDKSSNLDFIINYFDSGKPTVKKKKSEPYNVNLGRVILNKFAFRYKNFTAKDTVQGRSVNFDNVDVKDLSGIFEGLDVKDHLLKTNIKNLTLKEKSGFYLKNLTAQTTIDSNAIELKNLLLETSRSRLTNYYQMKFKTYRDFNHYIDKVRMKAVFKDSHLSSRDVAFFAPELNDMKLDIDIDGQITGLVNNLRAKKLSLKAGKATYIKGDFVLKGLPKWKETFMDLKIEMAGTNKTDLDEVLGGITNSKKKLIPVIVSKFGNINFNGSFTGFQNDFIAYGEFKTKLGRLVSDVNMKIDKNEVPSYTGNIKSYDFNIGSLLDEKSLGRITSSLYVKGRGTELKDLSEKINGDVSYIDFNGYRYRNVKIDGKFDKKYFDGKLTINDKNVKLAFDGGVNLNPKLPVFNFNATISRAKLKALKLLKDSLMVDAKFSTNFSGTNLNNIEGSLMVQEIRLQNPKGVYNVDSVQLIANGTGASRNLNIKSDILDASITGEYDLNSIVSYYKAIAKTYIPSLQADIFKYKNQIFKFNLKVKKFEPLAQLISPGLALDDGATLIGNFDSRNNTATLNGYVKTLKYNGIVVNNIILDENTTPQQLQLIVTSDRVQLNDSLFIKDVNISNILRNDSLAFNVKMSNSDEANQLDLNGLVEFTKNQDTTARLSVLPSILKINDEEWRIQEKVRIVLNNGKTQISNFDLTNGIQQLTIDGLISEDPKDLIEVGFKDFNLKTLNPFTKGFGVKLSGAVNGKTNLYGILKAPRVSDDIKIDSLNFNDIYIGTLTDTSSFSNATNKVTLFTRVTTRDSETFKLTGDLDLKAKEIDLELRMNDSKLTILEPFVKQLVSNLKGNISADLTVKGNFDKPKINGTLELDKGQLMVNYLKTTYVITDEVTVENSVINLKDFKLNDLEGHEAIGNGSVDLNDINDPTLNVTLRANSFMALNTTAKDNSVYYGKAYGTGVFKFNGPTSKMKIDINAKTEKGTVFNLPLNSSETISDKDFINFVSRDSTVLVKKTTNFDGLTLTFKLSIDPNTTANIYTTLGNLSGKGNADLNLNINSLGDFEMSGDYIIETGSFDFTAQEVINKKFEIRQGGTIRWTGNPTAAQINLKAVYALRANLSDLFKAANRDASSNANQRVDTEVEMGLTGLLLQPDIKLDIDFPSQPSIKEQLQTYFSDQNNLNLQAFSLIIRRSFAPGNGGESIGNQLSSTATSTATELVFNQFNNVLSSLNLNFVDLNVRSLSEANASFKFFNDRLIVNAGIVDRNSLNDFTVIDFSKNNVGSEVEALFLIKKDGSLIGKVANKPQTQQSIFLNSGISPTANVTSFGLVYTQQFDTFKEFIQKISGSYRRNLKRKQSEAPAKTNRPINKDAIINQEKNKQRR
ncbi:translocation/assembly module TamB domain-containing protein [Pedobacter endophyticus]|uniref:Translocation/assembly module TamB domain-containing protein n=1 Tax=Pedobacter endophyticus TaxID=2789740 RepID=A0A7S9KY55_9SPHI|nr:translocation/assembly module TamB domain-containing protein [Pedobacter endophyticus]QPH38965.1 translocation/assembly module TamB domain-containing protein [Pedobacter endophyticus]